MSPYRISPDKSMNPYRVSPEKHLDPKEPMIFRLGFIFAMVLPLAMIMTLSKLLMGSFLGTGIYAALGMFAGIFAVGACEDGAISKRFALLVWVWYPITVIILILRGMYFCSARLIKWIKTGE